MTPFRIIQLEQGTAEWRKWRHNGIGASDAPIIMGENPWKNSTQLLLEKRCESPSMYRPNAAMQRGTKLEPIARERFVLRTGKTVKPTCLQSNRFDWLKASIDGISDDFQTIVEIKCGESVYRKTNESTTVPYYYYGQLQHILAVTGASIIDFWCYLPGVPELHRKVIRDEAYIKRLLELEEAFWKEIQNR